MKKYLFLLITFCAMAQFSFAQLGYGFKAGLNGSTFRGDLESDDNGVAETFAFSTGFHVGAAVIYKATDIFGVKLELLFSQKGATRRYDGQSYFVLGTENQNPLVTTGTRKLDIAITNSYLDFPLMAYIKLGRKLELSGGVNVGILLGSLGNGELTYQGQSVTGASVESFTTSLEYNYGADEIGSEDLTNTIDRTIGTRIFQIPQTLNAYYEFDAKDGGAFRTIDFGLNAGLSFFVNRGLFIGFRANYGLSDVTKDTYDVSLSKLNNGATISRSDKDTNLSLQTSIGFSF